MATRLVVASDEDVKAFSEQPENENTKKKTWYNLQVSKEFSKIATKRRQMFYLSVQNRFQRFVVKEASHKSISRIQVRVSGRIFIKTFYNLGTRYFVPINTQNWHQSQLFNLYHVSLLPIY